VDLRCTNKALGHRATAIRASIEGVVPPTSKPRVLRLTAAEARVAELVAEGRSNKEIAAVVFVSAKTVDFHLSSI
jgi:DNA-binding NarL/FixJ family response regulator